MREGNKKIVSVQKGHDIGWAMSMLKQGYRVQRAIRPAIFALADVPAMKKQFLLMEYTEQGQQNSTVAFWNPSHEDTLATDYLLVGEPTSPLNPEQVQSLIEKKEE